MSRILAKQYQHISERSEVPAVAHATCSASSVKCFYGWVVVGVCVPAKVMKAQGQNNIMAYTVPHLINDLHLSNGEMGVLFAIATVSASCLQPCFGLCADKFGARACVSVSQVCLSVTLLCFSVSQRLPAKALKYLEVVVLFFFLRALSLGAMEIFPSSCLQKWFVRQRGRALSTVNTLQQLGNALLAPTISGLVFTIGWRRTARLGAVANLLLVLPTVLLMRKDPEACGLLPDGDIVEATTVPRVDMATGIKCSDTTSIAKLALASGSADVKAVGVVVDPALENQHSLPAGLCPLYVFSFFFAVMFGGCDFEMMGMVAEAGGHAGGVNVAAHIYAPMGLLTAAGGLVFGELMDKCSQGTSLSLISLSLCGFLAFLSTNLLVYASTPELALAYGLLRGLAGAIFQTLLNSGLAFAAFGVDRGRIGRILGLNSAATIAGTGMGPLIYGLAKDHFGSFRATIRASSLPLAILSVLFAGRVARKACRDCHAARSRAPSPAEQDEPVLSGRVFGKAAVAKGEASRAETTPAEECTSLQVAGAAGAMKERGNMLQLPSHVRRNRATRPFPFSP